MFEHFRSVPGTCWMITDVRHTRRYLRSYAMDPRAVKAMEAAGTMVKAPTLAALAGRIRVDAEALETTVKRFNGFCRAGVDNDFARGNSAYDRYYGDPSVHPNPNLGTIEKGPFAAVQVVPGDLGTKGGLLSDEHARVLREDGSVIEGLYVSGNNSASVMGHTYPGPGSTLGPAAVFGFIAAKHIASN
jgi:3-oxosteroid 1-dehydrogenase